jgi:hypothetical protein
MREDFSVLPIHFMIVLLRTGVNVTVQRAVVIKGAKCPNDKEIRFCNIK